MTASENFVLQGLKLTIDNLALEIMRQREDANKKSVYSGLPEWLTLEQAVKLKGGAALNTYRCKPNLQPCCGNNYKIIGGRRCWRREDIIMWLNISDEELEAYKRKLHTGKNAI
jgi:hypothetical protein